MKCPACERELERTEVGDIALDVCRNGCGGIWFDNFELEKVDEQHEGAGEALLDIQPDSGVHVDHSQVRPCPKCGDVLMMKHFVSVKHEVEVDECAGCGGIWLDFGELAHIRGQYTTDEQRTEAARAHFSEVFGEEMEKMRAQSEAKLHSAEKFARAFRFICPSYYIPGKQQWAAF